MEPTLEPNCLCVTETSAIDRAYSFTSSEGHAMGKGPGAAGGGGRHPHSSPGPHPDPRRDGLVLRGPVEGSGGFGS
jgi:hypothetical protein